MIKIDLCRDWRMTGNGYDVSGNVPGSVYSFLMENGLLSDPHYRDNEQRFLALMDHEYTFSKKFVHPRPDGTNRILLCCEGLDTLCEIYLNDERIASTDNMHRRYEFDITHLLLHGGNTLSVKFLPLDPYIKPRHIQEPLWDNPQAMMGLSHVRKSYCLMGLDWGPMLPDAGIWKDIYLLVENSSRITDVNLIQRHYNGNVFLTTKVEQTCNAKVTVRLTTPNHEAFIIEANQEFQIRDPQLWWPNGLGAQPMYTVDVMLKEQGEVVDRVSKRIGLRTMKLIRSRDVYGESFYHEVNGVPFFAMGGDYIPEDNILTRITPERSRKLLTQCRDCNFNAIRIWGGGYYPDNWFFDICDELGLVVFLDMMFACAMVPGDDTFIENITIEVQQNLTRLRHHPCIAVISGNNEVEESITQLENPSEDLKNRYIRIFEGLIADIAKSVCPDIPYVSSSPSSCGHFIDPTNDNYGDSHYWKVWHGGLPFTEYRNHYFRYLSEFGFQSFPCEKTVNLFTLPEDRNIFSRIMEMHQRSGAANQKILTYLADTFLYPSNFGTLLYASQLLQSEAIRYGVEHLRRNRGRCMGTLYWQINDIYPAASWSSIDYYGRFKSLQYVAKRFYTPILLSCAEIGEKATKPFVTMEPSYFSYETKATLAITNDTPETVSGTVRWALRSADASIITSNTFDTEVPAFSVKHFEELDFCKTDVSNHYMSYELEVAGNVISEGTVLLTAPKHFSFRDPGLRYEINGDKITVFANSYARSVEIYSPDSDFILSDNYFDMNAGAKTVQILEGTPKTITLRSVFDIR